MHVCDIQYFVENLQMQEERLRSVHVKEAVTLLSAGCTRMDMEPKICGLPEEQCF